MFLASTSNASNRAAIPLVPALVSNRATPTSPSPRSRIFPFAQPGVVEAKHGFEFASLHPAGQLPFKPGCMGCAASGCSVSTLSRERVTPCPCAAHIRPVPQFA